MITRLTIGFAAAAILTGCVTGTAATPRPLKPEAGPRGTVHVSYVGGTFTRRIQPRFRVESSSYVLVGHLGGDGRVRVLYPETPEASGWVSARKTISLKSYPATHDMAPHLFSFAMASYRTLGARMDSYDGLGHGYVFMIASRQPIDFEAVMDGGGFETLEIENYERERDPRYAVRSFADDIATGPYTLKFASSLGANPFMYGGGCQSAFGLLGYHAGDLSWLDLGYSYFAYPGSSLFSGFALANFYGYGQPSCRRSHYAFSPGIYRTRVVATVPTNTPVEPLTPRLQRPARRTLTDHERTTIVGGRPSVGRNAGSSARRTYDGRRSPFGDDRRSSAGRTSRPQDTQRTTTPSASSTTTAPPSGSEKATERPIPQR